MDVCCRRHDDNIVYGDGKMLRVLSRMFVVESDLRCFDASFLVLLFEMRDKHPSPHVIFCWWWFLYLTCPNRDVSHMLYCCTKNFANYGAPFRRLCHGSFIDCAFGISTGLLGSTGFFSYFTISLRSSRARSLYPPTRPLHPRLHLLQASYPPDPPLKQLQAPHHS